MVTKRLAIGKLLASIGRINVPSYENEIYLNLILCCHTLYVSSFGAGPDLHPNSYSNNHPIRM